MLRVLKQSGTCQEGWAGVTGHSDPALAVPGHPAPLADASSVWDVQLDTVPMA